ncbi:MAG: PAS domain S-box protein [Gammaproteobacteria bacterium]|nr:PAS domain S-box protein [Gammaproteobacteria bacterium]
MPEPISETSQPRPDQPHRSEAWTLLRSLYEAIPDPVWLKDPQGVYLACNPAFSAYYGAPEDIIVGKTDFDFVDAATAEFYRNKDWEAIAAGESCHNEEWFTYPDHQHRLFETTKTPIFRADGSLLGVLGIARDITDRKRAEEALRRSELNLRKAQEVAQVGSWSLDLRTNHLEWSEQTYRIFGFDPDTPLSFETFLDRIHPDDREAVNAAWTAALTDAPYDIVHRIVVNDAIRWVRERAELYFDAQGQLRSGVGTVQDITERHAITVELRRLSQAVEQSPLSIVVTDLNGQIEYVNPYFSQATGYSRDEVIGQNPRLLKSGEMPQEEYQRLWEMISHGGTWTGILHNRRKDGSLYWERAVIAPIRDAEGRITQYLGMKQDITVQKQLEDQLRQRERYQRALLDNFPFMVWLKDTHSRFLAVNQPFAEACSLLNTDAVVGKTDLDLWPYRVAERHQADDRTVLATRRKKAAEEQLIEQGKPLWVETYKAPVVDQDGALLGTVGFARDITDRKQAEERLRLAASVFDHAHEGIVITDAAARIIEVNHAFTELTGYTREEAIGRNPRFLQSGHHDAEFYARMWSSLSSAGVWTGELWNRKKNGELYAELASISVVRDTTGLITHYVNLFSDITPLKESQRQLEQMAYHDALTQLPNRVLLADRLRQAMARTQREGGLLAVVYLDLDDFKPINDCFGHTAGDRVLIQVAERLNASLRGGDTLSRIGGDEFVALISNLGDIAHCQRMLSRILEALAKPFTVAGTEAILSASLGVTLYPLDSADADALIRHADRAMYVAKDAGRNCYRLFDLDQVTTRRPGPE